MNNKKLTLEKDIIRLSNGPFLISAMIILCYSIFLADLGVKDTILTLLIITCLILVCLFIISPITNIPIARKTSKKVESWRANGLNKAERTQLFLELYRLPRVKRAETFTYYFVCAIGLAAFYHFFIHVDVLKNILNFIGCIFGSYIAALMSLSASSKAISPHAKKLVEQGIDDDVVREKKCFGTTYRTRFVCYVIIPIIFTAFIFIVLYGISIYMDSNGDFSNIILSKRSFIKIIIITVINIIACFTLISAFFVDIMNSAKSMQGGMNHILKNDIFTVHLQPTDISNEVTYNIYLVNKVVVLFRSLFEQIQSIGKAMQQPSFELAQIAEETATTAVEQSAGVKEILSTMEDTDEQTRGIVDKISSVTNIAEDTFKNVEAGFLTLQSELDKMNEITEANVSTITGIKDLGNKIGNIWEIVNIINDISEQTRIIAFNAELEASEAGEAGKSFHIVANEIRRLAAGITESVEQIRERITEIQHTSDNLIITSESGTEKIKEGRDLTLNLETKFSDIRKSSEITVESAVDIKNIVDQQSASFDQIVETIRQISAGIENFSASTNTVNQNATELKQEAENLDKLHEEMIEAKVENTEEKILAD